MTVRDKIFVGKYKTPYPTDDQRDGNPNAMKEYRTAEHAMMQRFRSDLEKENGIDHNHAKAKRLWDIAWSMGHTDGLSDVTGVYEDLAELLSKE